MTKQIFLFLAATTILGATWGQFTPPGDADHALEDAKLVTVVLVFRHGDRTPIKPYPKDPYKNTSYWPVSWGQLTNRGKQQHYELGKWFRKRYEGFLPDKYSQKDVYVRSTDVDRTLMSAESNLAGLFIPRNDQVWNPDIPWQPIPVHTKTEQDDAILAMKKPCPKYDLLYKRLKKSPEIVEINNRNKELYSYISENSGRRIKSITDLEFMYSVLNIETIYNLTLPAWTHSVFPDKMKSTAALSFALPCYNKELARLKAGPFFAEMLDHLYNTTVTMKHKYNRKLWMYSGHDTTVANILNSMGLFEYHMPPYTSTVMFELYNRGESDFYVNIFYKNSSEPQKMVLPGCEFNCPLDQFRDLLEDVTVPRDSWDDECRLSILAALPFDHYQGIFILTCIGILILLLVVLVVGIVCVKHYQEKRNHQLYFRIPDRDEHV